jgi:hypothetical protein
LCRSRCAWRWWWPPLAPSAFTHRPTSTCKCFTAMILQTSTIHSCIHVAVLSVTKKYYLGCCRWSSNPHRNPVQ